MSYLETYLGGIDNTTLKESILETSGAVCNNVDAHFDLFIQLQAFCWVMCKVVKLGKC